MSDKLEEALVEAIGKATDAAEAAGSFLAAELPDVIEQLLMWKLASSVMGFVLALSIAGACAWGCVRLGRNIASADKAGRYSSPGMDLGCALLGVASFVFAGFAVSDLFTGAKILIAPKVYLIEYAARLAS